jgi:hypothetical protein
MDRSTGQLSRIDPSDRILLLPHCLRRSEVCQAKYNSEGLQCVQCTQECPVNQLRSAALKAGYKGICVAPGGRLAISYVQEKKPKAIVAVACKKELEEGIQGVEELSQGTDIKPAVVIIPLVKDGCLDTEVDIAEAVDIINVCSMEIVYDEIV